MEDFTCQVIDIIKSIPPGCVSTYGNIAAAAGSPKGARQVSRILHSCTAKYDLPWYRVVGKGGSISLPSGAGREEQIIRLRAEGCPVNDKGLITDKNHILF